MVPGEKIDRFCNNHATPISQVTVVLRTFAPKMFPRTYIFFKLATQKGIVLLLPKRPKEMGGPRLRFWREHAPKNILNLKNRTSLANKAIVSVSPKIFQLYL